MDPRNRSGSLGGDADGMGPSRSAGDGRDALTGLLDRPALRRALVQRCRGARPFALLRLDIVGFGKLNECYGEDGGDRILRAVARRLRAWFGESAALARLGADEFAALVWRDECVDPATPAELAETVRRGVADRPIELGAALVRCPLAIGLAEWPDGAADAEELLRRAGLALGRARAADGPGACGVARDADLRARDHDRHVLEALWAAVQDRGLCDVLYQPQVDPRAGDVVGVEALLRVTHPADATPVPTEDLIRVAEETGWVAEFDRWVLRRALTAMRPFVRAVAGRRAAVNVSPRSLEPGFVDFVREALAATGFPPQALELEVTETGMVTSLTTPERVRVLRRLTQLGIHLVVDDIGTGHAGFSRLLALPADGFKVDRSITAGYGHERGPTELIRLFARIGSGLACAAVAEGVEDAGQMRALRRLGYGRVQGWHVAPAMTAPRLARWLADGRIRGAGCAPGGLPGMAPVMAGPVVPPAYPV